MPPINANVILPIKASITLATGESMPIVSLVVLSVLYRQLGMQHQCPQRAPPYSHELLKTLAHDLSKICPILGEFS
jgi:hypothetical protein